MNDPTRTTDPASKGPNDLHEADIGSGEKSPGEMETEEMIREIPALPPSGARKDQEAPGNPGQSKA